MAHKEGDHRVANLEIQVSPAILRKSPRTAIKKPSSGTRAQLETELQQAAHKISKLPKSRKYTVSPQERIQRKQGVQKLNFMPRVPQRALYAERGGEER